MEVFPGVAVDPARCAGQPHVAGSAVEVWRVLEALAGGRSPAELAVDLALSPAQVLAAVGYAAHVVRHLPPAIARPQPSPAGRVRAEALVDATLVGVAGRLETLGFESRKEVAARQRSERIRDAAREALRRRRETTIEIADFRDSERHHVRVEWGPVPHLGVTSDSPEESPRTRRYWSDSLRVYVNGELVDEMQGRPESWRVDLLVASLRDAVQQGLDAEEMPEFLRNFLESAAVVEAIDLDEHEEH